MSDLYEGTVDFGRQPTEFEVNIAKESPPKFKVGDFVKDIHLRPLEAWEIKIIFWSAYFSEWVYSSGKTNTFIGQSDLRSK